MTTTKFNHLWCTWSLEINYLQSYHRYKCKHTVRRMCNCKKINQRSWSQYWMKCLLCSYSATVSKRNDSLTICSIVTGWILIANCTQFKLEKINCNHQKYSPSLYPTQFLNLIIWHVGKQLDRVVWRII